MKIIKKSMIALVLLVSCTNKITGNIQVDNKAFPIQSCRAGEASSFNGIDLMGSDGKKLRLVYDPSMQAHAFLFLQNQIGGTDLGLCGPMSMERQSSRINNVSNQKGHVTLDCTAAGHHVVGEVSFENCH